jgi:hypothetical protein
LVSEKVTPLDRATRRRAAIVGGLVLALITGFGIGRAVDGGSPAGRPNGSTDSTSPGTSGGPADHTHDGVPAVDTTVGGLAVSSGGYTLALTPVRLTSGVAAPLRFRIDGPDRRPVTAFAIVHDRPMHLVVVRRDLSGYQHLHPTMAADGTWHVELTLPTPGSWRVYTDFSPVGAAGARIGVTLGADLTVAGGFTPAPLPAPAREFTVGGYTVTYEGTPRVGATLPLVFRVFRAGAPVPDLERYLGAYGHVVVLREGDLGYVHIHPEDRLFRGATKFWLAAPSQGLYRMFFEFQVAGKVHVASYTVVVS